MKRMFLKFFMMLFIVSLFETFAFNLKRNVKAETNPLVFSSVTKFNDSVLSNPSYLRIYFTFENVIESSSYSLVNEKKEGITDKVFINGKSVDEHIDSGNNITLRFVSTAGDVKTLEIRYLVNSEEPIDLVVGQTAFSIDAGFTTGLGALNDGVTAIYNGNGVNTYRDSSMSGLKTLMYRNFKQKISEYLKYDFSNENFKEIDDLRIESEEMIKKSNSCVQLTIGSVRKLLEIKNLCEKYKIDPINIVKVQKAYQYPNGDISFKVFVDKYIGMFQYTHVTMPTEYLETTIGSPIMFYTKESIKMLETYDVRNCILNNLYINNVSAREILELEGNDGLEEPVRVDYEYSNNNTKYYCFTVYLDGKSVYAKENVKTLDELFTISINNGFRVFGYTIDSDSTYCFDNSNKTWSLCDKKALNKKLAEIKSLASDTYTDEYMERIKTLKDRMSEMIESDSYSANDYASIIVEANKILSLKEYKKNAVLIEFDSYDFESKNGVFGYDFNFILEGVDIDQISAAEKSFMSLNSKEFDYKIEKMDNGFSLFLSASLLESGENILTLHKGMSFNKNDELAEDVSLKYVNGTWELIGAVKKTYDIVVTGDHVTVDGELTVMEGNNVELSLIPDEDYMITAVFVDGVNKGVINKCSFVDVSSNHTIQVFTKTNSSDSKKNGCKNELSIFGFSSLILCVIPFITRRKENV